MLARVFICLAPRSVGRCACAWPERKRLLSSVSYRLKWIKMTWFSCLLGSSRKSPFIIRPLIIRLTFPCLPTHEEDLFLLTALSATKAKVVRDDNVGTRRSPLPLFLKLSQTARTRFVVLTFCLCFCLLRFLVCIFVVVTAWPAAVPSVAAVLLLVLKLLLYGRMPRGSSRLRPSPTPPLRVSASSSRFWSNYATVKRCSLMAAGTFSL